MKLFDRYLLQQFLGTFVLVVLALPFLFLITDLTDSLDGYLDQGLSMRVVATSYLYYFPQLIFWGFPIAALMATVFTIGNMTRHQEIAAAKAGGVSFYRLAAPIFLIAALLSGVAVAIGEGVPAANQRRAEMLGIRERYTLPMRMNLVYRTESGGTLSANQLNAISGSMDNVVIESGDPDTGLWVHKSAASANWTVEDGWSLREGYLRWKDAEGVDATLHFSVLRTPELQERPEDLLTSSKTPEEMRYDELQRSIGVITRSGGDSSELEVNKAQRLSLPLALLVIVLFGAPLATNTQRGGTAFGVGISLAVTLAYLMLFKVGEALGKSGAVNPLVASWAPNALFLAAGIVLLWRVRT